MASKWPTVGGALGALAAVTAAVVPSSGELAASQVCGEPFTPVYFQTAVSGRDDPPPAIDAAPVSVTPVDLRVNPDFDFDGAPDHEHSPSEPAEPTVRRPTGDITFARVGERLDVARAGNLDGNPGEEIWVVVFDPTGARVAADAYVVPYETPAGTYDPATVGIRVPPGVPWPTPESTGDGVPDVVDIDSTTGNLVTGTTQLLSGADVMAGGVPGDARGVPPVATIPGSAQALADFGGPGPAIITVEAGASADGSIFVRVFDGSVTTVFTTGPTPQIGGADILPGGVAAHSGADGRFVTLSGANRSGTFTYWWSLDDPCTALSASAAPTSPVSAAPRFTG